MTIHIWHSRKILLLLQKSDRKLMHLCWPNKCFILRISSLNTLKCNCFSYLKPKLPDWVVTPAIAATMPVMKDIASLYRLIIFRKSLLFTISAENLNGNFTRKYYNQITVSNNLSNISIKWTFWRLLTCTGTRHNGHNNIMCRI